MAEYRMELWGEMCPVPLLKAEKKLKGIAPQDTLVLQTDHSCTARTISNWARKKQYYVTVDEVANGIWEISIQKK